MIYHTFATNGDLAKFISNRAGHLYTAALVHDDQALTLRLVKADVVAHHAVHPDRTCRSAFIEAFGGFLMIPLCDAPECETETVHLYHWE